ncbi:MAG: aminotransferase class I/II-fold pyridoxal phosphate-dependent enzyme [Bacteroidetes bacterium]|jgi:dTDP-4-amino-4,6-dideoxygalactose transaminase|nr:aminotransferase class I/II-fold pyridoxal phosphate-dependent enzyme [Bacteroidota bacterium]
MKKIQMVDLVSQYEEIQDEILEGIKDILSKAQFINGPSVHSFSEDLARYHDQKHAIPCGNGTDALQIAMMSLDLEPGDEVITTPFTFIATAEVIALLQLKPVFVDINPNTFNIDEVQIESAITSKTKAIVPVHLFGQCCEMNHINRLAEKHGLHVIEDNAQSIGANYRSPDGSIQKSGTLGDIGATSFFPSKNLGGYGDGGAIVTNNDELANRMRSICNHGSTKRYHHDHIGVNSRLDSIQAHVLNVKLKHLDRYIQSRINAADRYDELLKDVEEVKTPFRASFSSHVFHQYTLRVSAAHRDGLIDYFSTHNIPCGVYYPIPLHLQDAYKTYGYKKGDYPKTEQASKEVMSLPMHTELDYEQQEVIAKHIKSYLASN